MVPFLGRVVSLLVQLSSLVSHVTDSDPSWGPLKSFASSFWELLLLWAELWCVSGGWAMFCVILWENKGQSPWCQRPSWGESWKTGWQERGPLFCFWWPLCCLVAQRHLQL